MGSLWQRVFTGGRCHSSRYSATIPLSVSGVLLVGLVWGSSLPLVAPLREQGSKLTHIFCSDCGSERTFRERRDVARCYALRRSCAFGPPPIQHAHTSLVSRRVISYGAVSFGGGR